MRLTLAATALAALLLACSTPSSRIEQMFEGLRHDVQSADPVRGPQEELEEEHAERAKAVREIVASGADLSAVDRFRAATLLVQTEALDDLELAERLGREAGDLGEPRGYRVAAEAIDKRALIRGEPQIYGTQYVFEAVLASWRLYTVDPRTTDLERSRMGVPTYAELLRAEDELNKSTGMKQRPR